MTWDAKADTVGQDTEDGASVVHEVKSTLFQVEPGWVSQSCGWDLTGGERGQKLAERTIKASFSDFLVSCSGNGQFSGHVLAETNSLAEKLSEKMTILEEISQFYLLGSRTTRPLQGTKRDWPFFR